MTTPHEKEILSALKEYFATEEASTRRKVFRLNVDSPDDPASLVSPGANFLNGKAEGFRQARLKVEEVLGGKGE